MDQTIFYIIIIVLLAIITTIICFVFIYVLKSLKKISKTAHQFKEKKEWIFVIVDALIKLINRIIAICKKKKPKK